MLPPPAPQAHSLALSEPLPRKAWPAQQEKEAEPGSSSMLAKFPLFRACMDAPCPLLPCERVFCQALARTACTAGIRAGRAVPQLHSRGGAPFVTPGLDTKGQPLGMTVGGRGLRSAS